MQSLEEWRTLSAKTILHDKILLQVDDIMYIYL